VVAFRASRGSGLDVYRLYDLLTKRGWNLNALQFPPALHFCFTARSAGCVPALLNDMRECVAALREERRSRGGGGKKDRGGMAPVYGLAAALPDRGAVGDVLVMTQDILLEL
jgi:sphinganine-1-phosphate aldolase